MEIEVEDRTLITVKGTTYLAEVDPISDGFWVALGHVGAKGIFIDHQEWDAFVRLINMVDSHIETNYRKCEIE